MYKFKLFLLINIYCILIQYLYFYSAKKYLCAKYTRISTHYLFIVPNVSGVNITVPDVTI